MEGIIKKCTGVEVWEAHMKKLKACGWRPSLSRLIDPNDPRHLTYDQFETIRIEEGIATSVSYSERVRLVAAALKRKNCKEMHHDNQPGKSFR